MSSKITEKHVDDFTDAPELINFRIMQDGTLERREGINCASSLTYAIRCSIVYDEVIYFISNNSLYCYNGTISEYIDRLASCVFYSNKEKVFAFEYGGILHFIGGGCYYTYDAATYTLTENTCHTPLLCSEDADSVITYHEPLNMVSRNAKKHFYVKANEQKYYLMGEAESVTEVLLDGVPFKQYTFTQNGTNSYITVSQASLIRNKKEIVISYTLTEESHPGLRENVFRNTSGFLYKKDNQMRLFLYNPSDITGTVYFSEPSYDIDGNRTNTFDYFTALSFFNAGSGSKGVLGFANLSGNTLLFTKDETYQLTESEGKMSTGLETSTFGTKLITNERGISNSSSVLLCDDMLYIMCHNGLYRYSYNKFTYDFIVTKIDIPGKVIPSREKYKETRLFLCRIYDELWLIYDDRIAVYNMLHKKWYLFTGIDGDSFLIAAGKCYFVKGSSLNVFSNSLNIDLGTFFESVCETTWYTFDSPFSNKTLYTFGAVFDNITGAELKCTVRNDKGEEFEATFTPDPHVSTSPYVAKTHARLSRSAYFICRLESAKGKPPANIRAIFFRYRNQGGRQ